MTYSTPSIRRSIPLLVIDFTSCYIHRARRPSSVHTTAQQYTMAIARFTRLAAPALRTRMAVRASSSATVHGNDPDVSGPVVSSQPQPFAWL